MSTMQLPHGFRMMENQVAGHTFTESTLGMLKEEDNGNCVLKPLGKPECGKRELSFYEALESKEDKQHLLLKPLVPKFYNKVHLTVNQKQYTFIKLEDLTYNMVMPCVMDVKIGRRTWDPLATAEKRKVEEEKYIQCKRPLGLCLPGFQMYRLDYDNIYKLYRCGKEYGKNLDESGFRDTIALFLHSKQSICKPLVEDVLRQLYNIRDYFNTQNLYHFYASSILITYDAAGFLPEQINGYTNSNTSSSKKNTHKVVKVRMIDLAHVFPAEGGQKDENYLFGLRNLIKIIEDLLKC